MMLHEIQSTEPKKNKKRIGRGGKRGTYSGKGIKGQKSRAGAKIRPAIRDFMNQTPKLRGVKNIGARKRKSGKQNPSKKKND